MHRKRALLFAAAALGAILAITGVGIVVWAWIYPKTLIQTLGATVTPGDLMAGLRTQLLGTILGVLATAAGVGSVVLCNRALARDLKRMKEEMGICRGVRRP